MSNLEDLAALDDVDDLSVRGAESSEGPIYVIDLHIVDTENRAAREAAIREAVCDRLPDIRHLINFAFLED